MTHSPEQLSIPRIGLIGTACVGKSTVLNRLSERYGADSGVVFIGEVARPFFEAHPEIKDRKHITVQELLMNKIIEAEAIAEQQRPTPRVLVMDRTPHCAPVNVASTGDYRGADRLLGALDGRQASYRLLLLDVEGVPFEGDGLRDEDITRRQKIHDTFLGYLGDHGIPFTLIGGTLMERVAQVDGIIQDSLSNK